MARIRVTQAFSRQDIHQGANQTEVGEELEVDDDVAEKVIANGWAEPIDDAEPAPAATGLASEPPAPEPGA